MHVHTPINNQSSSAYIPWVYDALLDQVCLNYTANHLVRRAIAPDTTQDLTWGAFAAAALTSGITSQTPADLMQGGTNFFTNLYHGAVGSGLNRLFGVKEEQDWASVIGTAVGQSVGNTIASSLASDPTPTQAAIDEKALYLALAERNRKSVTINGQSVSETNGTRTTGNGSTGNTAGTGSATVTIDSNGNPITTYSTTYRPADRGYEVSSNGDVYYPTRGNEDRIVINWHSYRQLYVDTQKIPTNLDDLFKKQSAQNRDFRLLHGFRTAQRDFRIEESKVRSVKQISDSASLVGFFGPAKQLGFKTADYAASKFRQLTSKLRSFKHGKVAGAAFRNGKYVHSLVPRSNLELYGQAIRRTPDEAKGILHKLGYEKELLDQYHFIELTDNAYKRFAKDIGEFDATYGTVPSGLDLVSFNKHIESTLVNGDRRVPIYVNKSVFNSDESIVQVFSHELHEIESLRDILRTPATLKQYRDLVRPDRIHNLHYEAVMEGDDMLRAFRQLRGF